MSEKTAQIAEMVDMLPEQDQALAFELIKKLVLAWDPDFNRLTKDERHRVEEAENDPFIPADDIDWSSIGV
jgi:hypothetical protein